MGEFKPGVFQPNKALPWKDWIIDKYLQGMAKTKIHQKLVKEFPEAADVRRGSVLAIIKKIEKTDRSNKNFKINKSEEIRKVFKEMIKNGIEPKRSSIIKTLSHRGIQVTSSHVGVAIGPTTSWKTLIQKESKDAVVCDKIDSSQIDFSNLSVEDLSLTKDFIEKVGGLEKATEAMKLYKALGTSVVVNVIK